MQVTDIAYEADGAHLVGRLFLDEGRDGRRPGVLVAPEGLGLSDHTFDIARRLAEAGYAAFAMDYYGDGAALSMEEVMPRLGVFMADPLKIRARAAKALSVLASQPQTDPDRLAAIGFCFGGTTALELARSGADIKAAVGFHSGLGTARPDDAKDIKAKVLVCIGADDPLVPPDQRLAFEKEMNAGGVDWRFNLYGGAGHSFSNPMVDQLGRPGFAYHEPTWRRAWRAMIDLFDEAFA
ncbi:dienelactone hydrolase family protein [Phenylobacterium montanum]|uniref:Dienelactone hydrolase family protein n=1 Tax=Phenylobacterium montanum TaxID=2823693 RepID=A0A975G3K0_9CAUL|nr:dienelactone hydrolase family protein [Caulobacter sp. S6]QUD89932.1 dienelactone hydrolase family protein [Caulobacter sp. S6]